MPNLALARRIYWSDDGAHNVLVKGHKRVAARTSRVGSLCVRIRPHDVAAGALPQGARSRVGEFQSLTRCAPAPCL
eukprot:6187680-Pleurochrysis_carterae.AAC.1